MHFLSILLSAFLHVALVVVVLYWPAGTVNIRLDKPVYQVKLISLAEKKAVARKPKVTKTTPKVAAPKGKPSIEKPKPVPQKVPDSTSKPAPKPVAKPISAKKAAVPPSPKPTLEKKKKEPPKKKPKPKEPPKKKPKPKKAAKKKPKKRKPSGEELLRQALAAAEKDVDKREKAEAKSVEEELAALKDLVEDENAALREALTELGGDVQQSEGEGVIGSIEDVYALAVQKIIQKNWRFTKLATRTVLVASVRIAISRQGEILDAKVVTPSGRVDFDASTLRAVADTKLLPPPPTVDIDSVVINFNSQEQ